MASADSARRNWATPIDTVMLPIYALHRHHLLWDRPDAFDPDRFLTSPGRYAFLPFGAGPRICIGASFALQEAVIILSTLLARFVAYWIGWTPAPTLRRVACSWSTG